MFAITAIKGVGRRFANIALKKADLDLVTKEDPRPPWSAPLLGRPCPWSAHKDHRQAGSHSRRLQEEVNSPPFASVVSPLSQ